MDACSDRDVCQFWSLFEFQTINTLEQQLNRLHEVPVASPEDKQNDDRDLRDMRRTIHDLEAEVEKLVHSEQSFRIRNKQLEDEIRNLKTLKEVTSGAKLLSKLALVSTDGYHRVVEMAI